MGVMIIIDPQHVRVEPGREVAVGLRIRNTGRVVDEVHLEVLGRTTGWAEITPRSVNLFPGAEERAVLRFFPPRSPSVPAGAYPFGVRAASSEDPSGSAVEEGSVEVLPFRAVRSAIVPVTSYGILEGQHNVQVTNDGNAPLSIALDASDLDQLLDLSVQPRRVQLDPGASATARVVVRPATVTGRQAGMSRAFDVRLADAAGAPLAVLNGAFQPQAARSRRWPWVLPIGALALVAAFLVWRMVPVSAPGGGGGSGGTQAAAETSQAPLSPVVTDAPVTAPTITDRPISVPPLVTVPDVRLMDEVAATDLLASLGLSVGGTTAENSEDPIGTVLRTDPGAGFEVEIGSSVVLVLSSGPAIVPGQATLRVTTDPPGATIEVGLRCINFVVTPGSGRLVGQTPLEVPITNEDLATCPGIPTNLYLLATLPGYHDFLVTMGFGSGELETGEVYEQNLTMKRP